MGENTNYQKCRLCGADSNGAELCPRCDIRQAEDGPGVKTAALAAALVAAQQAAQAVEKSSANTFHRYKYASAESVIAEARGALSSAGLSLSALSSDLLGTPQCPVLHTVYLLEHLSGESRAIRRDMPVIEDKGRPLDKAVSTASTYSLGYTLRDLLLLPRLDEGAVDQRDDRHHEPAKPVDAKREAEIGAILEQRIGDAKTMRELNEVVADLVNSVSPGKVRDYLREKFAQRKTELSKPSPAKAGVS